MLLYVVIAAMFFMAYLQAGHAQESLSRCVACGSRIGEKHHRDCQYKDR